MMSGIAFNVLWVVCVLLLLLALFLAIRRRRLAQQQAGKSCQSEARSRKLICNQCEHDNKCTDTTLRFTRTAQHNSTAHLHMLSARDLPEYMTWKWAMSKRHPPFINPRMLLHLPTRITAKISASSLRPRLRLTSLLSIPLFFYQVFDAQARYIVSLSRAQSLLWWLKTCTHVPAYCLYHILSLFVSLSFSLLYLYTYVLSINMSLSIEQ